MPSMILCPSCKRHVFTREASCPFCGLAISSEPGVAPPSATPEMSRAQRYAVGAAIAATFATAGCGSPTTVQNADDVHVVDVGNTNGDGSDGQTKGNGLEVARDPSDGEVLADPEAERRRQQELERRRLEQQRIQEEMDWRTRRGGSCGPNGQCPPYGCVFPDEACDILRV